MAVNWISRALVYASNTGPSLSVLFCERLSLLSSTTIYSKPIARAFSSRSFLNLTPNLHSLALYDTLKGRSFCSTEPTKVNTKVNFSPPDSDSDDDDTQNKIPKEIDKSKLPPPYDPFNKKPVIEEPDDPKDLQEVFHKMRSEGLFNSAVKMFDGLSKDGLTHEALELFAQIKDKGQMPDVVAHTAVIEAYANAGQAKEALKVYLKMLASGVLPNAYTYSILIKGLAKDAKYMGDAKKYLLEMMGKGMRPNVGVYTAVIEAFVKEDKVEEARKLLQEMKGKGFVPDEKSVKEVLNSKRGPVFRSVMNILFGK